MPLTAPSYSGRLRVDRDQAEIRKYWQQSALIRNSNHAWSKHRIRGMALGCVLSATARCGAFGEGPEGWLSSGEPDREFP